MTQEQEKKQAMRRVEIAARALAQHAARLRKAPEDSDAAEDFRAAQVFLQAAIWQAAGAYM